jgi:two-component system copper resistance phosphate regulon response regulator CusR
MRILLAEDDLKVGKHVQQALQAEGYAIDWAKDGEEALWMAQNNPYDAVVLDVMLPQRDGLGVVRQLRRDGSTIPVLFLTAKTDVNDRVRGLDAGADDYLTKPFSILELSARVRSLIRRQRPQFSNQLRVEDVELDLVGRTVRRAGKPIELTNREFALLELLMSSSPNPVSKAHILERVWDHCFDSETNLVNVHLNHLRNKIDQPGLPPLIQTLRGKGFAFRKEMA